MNANANQYRDGIADRQLPDLLDNSIVLKHTKDTTWTNVPHLVVHHSPTGYQWGYGGSGPADLALNIVEWILRQLEYDGPKTDDTWDKTPVFRLSMVLHHYFMGDFIMMMPDKGGTISMAAAMQWVNARMNDEIFAGYD